MRGIREPRPAVPRAVVFSLGALCSSDGTRQHAERAFRATAEYFGIADDRPNFALYWSRFSQASRWYETQRFYRQRDKVRSARLAGLRALGIAPTDDDLDMVDAIWARAAPADRQSHPAALPLLSDLRAAGLRIGILSNAECAEFHATLRRAGLAAFADAAVCSEEAASCKPDPVIYYETLRRLGATASETLFVTSSPGSSLRGAHIVGMRTVLLAREGAQLANGSGLQPDFVISTLSEVATLVTHPAPAGGPRVRRRDPSPAMAGAHS